MMTTHRDNREQDSKYERRDINIRSVGIFGVVLLLIIGALSYAVTFWLFRSAGSVEQGPPPTPLLELQRPPAPPVLQAMPEMDLQSLRAREAARLESYGWVDRDAGRVHVPISRAMELIEERARESAAASGVGGREPR